MDNLVQVAYENNNLICIVKTETEAIRHETNIQLEDIKKDWFFTACWILSKCTKFFDLMPFEFEFSCAEEVYPYVENALNYCSNVLVKTNDAIKASEPNHNIAGDNEHVLYVNVSEDLRYKSFYNVLKDNKKVDVHYLNMDLGFNRKTRQWEKERPEPISIPDLQKFIIDNNIKKIVSVNEYFLNYYMMAYNIHLATLLSYMGVEFIVIDNDPYDLNAEGFYRKVIQHNDKRNHFCNLKCLNYDLDEFYELKNITYNAIPQDYRKKKIKKFKKDYNVIVLTNSRLSNVEQFQGTINNMLGIMPPETIFEDLVNWYMAMRAVILSDERFSETNRFHMNSSLHGFFYTFANWLKYKIIENVKTDKPFHVYGDEGFKKICPDLYRGSLDNNEINELFKGDNLYLLMNFSYTYLDASGPVYDMARRGAPWINVTTPIKSEYLKDLSLLEYNNDMDELNYKINNAEEVYSDGKLITALDNYRLTLKSSVDEMKSIIVDSKPKKETLFQKEMKIHEDLISVSVSNYLDNNQDILKKSFKILFGI